MLQVMFLVVLWGPNEIVLSDLHHFDLELRDFSGPDFF